MIRRIFILAGALALCGTAVWLGVECRQPLVAECEEVARVVFCSRPLKSVQKDDDDRRQGIALAEFRSLTEKWKDRGKCSELLMGGGGSEAIEELLKLWDKANVDLILEVDGQGSSGGDVTAVVRTSVGMTELIRPELQLLQMVLEQGVSEMNQADIIRAAYKESQEKLRLETIIRQLQDQLSGADNGSREMLSKELIDMQSRVRVLNARIDEIGRSVMERRGRTLRWNLEI